MSTLAFLITYLCTSDLQYVYPAYHLSLFSSILWLLLQYNCKTKSPVMWGRNEGWKDDTSSFMVSHCSSCQTCKGTGVYRCPGGGHLRSKMVWWLPETIHCSSGTKIKGVLLLGESAAQTGAQLSLHGKEVMQASGWHLPQQQSHNHVACLEARMLSCNACIMSKY